MKNYQPFALHQIDSYKLGHKDQYPVGTSLIYSNFTPRNAKHALKGLDENFDEKVVSFGFQATIQEIVSIFNDSFFSQPKEKVITKFKQRTTAFAGKELDTSHIEALHDLGYLPLHVKAIEEGNLVPMKVPVITLYNTLPEFYWLTNFIETWMSAESWKIMTAATTAYRYRKVMENYAQKTGSPKDFIWWQGHDFSNRGMSGMLDAAKTSSGHLLSFMGSDSISSVDYIESYYTKDGNPQCLVAGSVPATEHSVMCMGEKETELETFKRLMTEVYPSGLVSIVSDTWNFWDIMTKTAPALKDVIMTRQKNELGVAKVVFRPDSGDPVAVVCGTAIPVTNLSGVERALRNVAKNKPQLFVRSYQNKQQEWVTEYFEASVTDNSTIVQRFLTVDEITPEMKGAVECLWEGFGGTITEQGYRLIDEHVGLIYGDSITIKRCEQILERLMKKGFASSNIVLGIGSYTYQYVTRDTFGFAMKSTYGEVNGVGREIFKDPITDNGVKKSAKGLLTVTKQNGEYVMLDQQTWERENTGELKTIFKDGKFFNFQEFKDIRQRLVSQ
jgi:nicotinamide phosphoribosyltransferase